MLEGIAAHMCKMSNIAMFVPAAPMIVSQRRQLQAVLWAWHALKTSEATFNRQKAVVVIGRRLYCRSGLEWVGHSYSLDQIHCAWSGADASLQQESSTLPGPVTSHSDLRLKHLRGLW
jgi:hypothetical protein